MADKEEAKEVKEAKKESAGAKSADKPKNKLKLIIIGVAAAVLLGGGGAGFMLMKGKSTASESAHEVKDEHEAQESAKGHGGSHGEEKGGHGAAKAAGGGGGAVMKLEPFIVNLQDNSGTRYLKLTLNLELASNANSSEIESQEARIRDSLIVLLSSKSYTDVGTVEGKYQLRDEIVARINQFLSSGKVKTAYFTEFVIQ